MGFTQAWIHQLRNMANLAWSALIRAKSAVQLTTFMILKVSFLKSGCLRIEMVYNKSLYIKF